MHRLAVVTPSAVLRTSRHWSSSANGSGEASRSWRRCVSSSNCGREPRDPGNSIRSPLEQESMLKRLIVLVASVLLVGAVGCGSSSHRRAYAVLDRAEAAVAEIHALHDEANGNLVEQHQERPESCPETGWSPEVFLGFGIPRETRNAMSEAENRLRVCRGSSLRSTASSARAKPPSTGTTSTDSPERSSGSAPSWKLRPRMSSTKSSSEPRPTRPSGSTSTRFRAPER